MEEITNLDFQNLYQFFLGGYSVGFVIGFINLIIVGIIHAFKMAVGYTNI